MAADPGLMRLKLAARGTLSVFLAGLAAVLGDRLAQVPPIYFANGVTLSMMAPFLMREPTRRQRQYTLATLILPAAAAAVVVTLLHGQKLAGDGLFLALVFLCFLLHPLHPRMVGIGLVGIISAYVGLFLNLPPATLPWQVLSLPAAGLLVAFACFVAVPMNPAATLRGTVQAVQWRAARVLHSAQQLAAAGTAPEVASERLRRDLVRLNAATLAADEQLALMQPGGRDTLRFKLVELELATNRLIRTLHEGKPGRRHAIRLQLHERRMRRGRRYLVPPSRLERGSLLAGLVELGHIVHGVGAAARTIVPITEAAPARRLPPGPLAWRVATRVTLAAALAMAGGMALSPQRWFWAVITVYVVFLNTRSRGDTIYKGVQRLGGTLLGMVSGLALATLVAGHGGLETVVLMLAIFGMFYLFLVSYTVAIFCVTVMLGLLYGLLGASVEPVLLLRLEETAIGAAAAVLVAAFVLPTRTRDQVMQSGRNVLTALVETVQASREALSGVAGAAPMEAVRRVDRQVTDLRLALAPLTVGRLLRRRTALERPVPALLACVHWARMLAAVSHVEATAPGAAVLAGRAAQIEARLAGLAGVRKAPGSSAPSAEPADPAPQTDGVDPDSPAAVLDNLEMAVERLAKRLEAGALEGFALGP